MYSRFIHVYMYVNNHTCRMMSGVIALAQRLLFIDASCIVVPVVSVYAFCYRLFAHVYFKTGVWCVG
jgi:hypothetical protein